MICVTGSAGEVIAREYQIDGTWCFVAVDQGAYPGLRCGRLPLTQDQMLASNDLPLDRSSMSSDDWVAAVRSALSLSDGVTEEVD